MLRSLLVGIGLLLVSACATINSGRIDPGPPLTGVVFARSGVGDPHGIRVLSHGAGGRDWDGTRAWLASDDVEFEQAWHRAGIISDPPSVDFSENVVFVLTRDGGACEPKIVGFSADTSGQLTVEYDRSRLIDTCIMVAIRTHEIIAVPRRMLPASVVYLWGFRFLVEPPPPA